MLDWKILAASFAALLVVSSALMGSFSLDGNPLSGIFDKIGEWLGGSTISMSPQSTEEVEIIIKPNILSIPINSKSSASINSVELKNFHGSVIVDYDNSLLTFNGPDGVEIQSSLKQATIKETIIEKLVVENTVIEIIKGEWSEKTDTSKVEISNFNGDIEITEADIHLKGTVSSIVK